MKENFNGKRTTYIEELIIKISKEFNNQFAFFFEKGKRKSMFNSEAITRVLHVSLIFTKMRVEISVQQDQKVNFASDNKCSVQSTEQKSTREK